MPEMIRDGTGKGHLQKITSDHRALTDGIVEPLSAERSRQGQLFGIGTGNLTLPSNFSGPVIWFRNDDPDNHMYVQKIIFGWNGGTTPHDETVFSLINYQTTEPNTNNTPTDFAIENISLEGKTAKETGQIWDGVGTTGMGGSSGGFPQIANRVAIGDTSIPVDGEIILGQGDTMRFDITPEAAGLFNLAVVVYFAPPGGREDI